ncbi:MAG: c-type cytochrome [Burkholderiales bacterium]
MKGKFLLAAVLASCLSASVPPSVAAEEEIPEANPYSGVKERIDKGKRYFRQNTCTACHGGRADGQGDMGTGADLRKLRLGFKRYVQTVKSGRKVEGRQQFMPAFGHLSNDEIYHIGAYLETLALPEANWKEGAKN